MDRLFESEKAVHVSPPIVLRRFLEEATSAEQSLRNFFGLGLPFDQEEEGEGGEVSGGRVEGPQNIAKNKQHRSHDQIGERN